MLDFDLFDPGIVLPGVLLSVALGVMTALVARGKGRSLIAWWLYGTLMPLIGLFHAMLLAPKLATRRGTGASAIRRCPYCAEAIKPELDVCPECWRVLPVEGVAADSQPVPAGYDDNPDMR
jgi:hypothetical protein